MKRFALLFSLLVLGFTSIQAQKYFTRDGKITFSSDTPIEKIEAHNQKATCVLNAADGRMEFAVLIKAFQFEKALMQEHFNENYMESATYPKATFKGQISNIEAIDFSKDGNYEVTVAGDMTIHGVTQAVSTTGNILVKDGKLSADATFETKPGDYDIKIPAVVRKNIAEIVQVTVAVDLVPFNK